MGNRSIVSTAAYQPADAKVIEAAFLNSVGSVTPVQTDSFVSGHDKTDRKYSKAAGEDDEEELDAEMRAIRRELIVFKRDKLKQEMKAELAAFKGQTVLTCAAITQSKSQSRPAEAIPDG